jgi:hypothetical protein
MKYNYIIIGLLSVGLLIGCKSKKKIADSSRKKNEKVVIVSKKK